MNKVYITIVLSFFNIFAFAADIDPSGYALFSGGKFYVLTDGVFSSNDEIKVRFEDGGNNSLKEYGGVDVRLYRVPDPIDFLLKQKNLHRPDVKGYFEGEGLVNVFSYLWDSWYKKTRLAWQKIFSTTARETAVKTVPQLKQTPAHTYKTNFSVESQFKLMPGMQVVDTFRYPVWQAKSEKINQNVTMEGSSSNFFRTDSGNIYLPLGKRKPGLYLVEAIVGSFRATTLVFVSDNLLVSKVSSNQAFVWTANRENGSAATDSKIFLTDGVGVLDQGKTNNEGVYVTKREIPERTYVFMQDEAGGVSISENFFFDSEVFQPKVYIFTDRPLYQPGDVITVRALGRNVKRDGFRDLWSTLLGAEAKMSIVDASGVTILSKKVKWNEEEGCEQQFRLPDSADSGGYSIRLLFEGENYGSAFRVARYIKPHFDAQIVFSKPSYKVGESVKGRIVLSYPSGQPVVGAKIDLQLRSEKMTVYEGSYGYNGRAPVELVQKSFISNVNGEVEFDFPAADKPSRYIATARAFDQAAYRVSTKKEVLIEGFLESYILTTEFSATQPGIPLLIKFDKQGSDAADVTQKLKSWQAIRLEDRSVVWGELPNVDKGEFILKLDKAGHYVIRVVDAGGVTRGVRSHVILGADLKSNTGQVEILADRDSYSIGDTATLILTFPEPTDQALLTLERNEVSSYGSIKNGSKWFTAKRMSPTQWKVEVPVVESYSPNVVISVANVKNGDFSFQNKGLVVKKPVIQLTFRYSKSIYAPHEKVRVDLETTYDGKPISALVAVGVVDEMIYVLQPEIAPSINDFFHHIRRNQVRTSSSLSFYSFNPSISEIVNTPVTYRERDLKLLQERSRRDMRDTAYWNGQIKTDSNGKAYFEFKMPDALTRWRITARAISLTGLAAQKGSVGESKAFISSQQDFYLKWSGPTLFREGDRAKPTIIAFNMTGAAKEGLIKVTANNFNSSYKINMKPGVNTLVLDDVPSAVRSMTADLIIDQKQVDKLVTDLKFVSSGWTKTQSTIVSLEKGSSISLPQDAKNIRLKVIPNSLYHIQRIADSLVEYPWGCVEQTSSRLIPLVMAAKAMVAENSTEPELKNLVDTISSERRRLVSMAGPQAVFTWWGDQTHENLLMTAHAYHADFRASKYLGIDIPKENWEHLLRIYANNSESSIFAKAYTLWVLSYMGLPVREQIISFAQKLDNLKLNINLNSMSDKLISSAIDSEAEGSELAYMLTGALLNKYKLQVPINVANYIRQISNTKYASVSMRAAQLLYLAAVKSNTPNNNAAIITASELKDIFDNIRYETPTIDRSIILAFMEEIIPTMADSKNIVKPLDLKSEWKKDESRVLTYFWKGKGLPTVLPELPGMVAEVIYDSLDAQNSALNVNVVRKLYKINFDENSKENGGDGEVESDDIKAQVSELPWGVPVDPRGLYIDEITLEPKTISSKFLLVEVPIPPGGEVDGKTWGLSFPSFEANFVDSKDAKTVLSYSVPIESLDKPIKIHQLIRFGSRGNFELPPVKVFKMYRSNENAFETGIKSHAINVQ